MSGGGKPTQRRSAMSKYERRAARQRELERMEAQASGVNAAMDLGDPRGRTGSTGSTSSSSSAGVRGPTTSASYMQSMRQRNQESARKFLYDEDVDDEAIRKGGTVRSSGTAGLFLQQQQDYGQAGGFATVNLMDPEAGIYAPPERSYLERMGDFLLGEDPATSGGDMPHDAIAADEEIYLGVDAPKPGSVQALCLRCRYYFCSTGRRLSFFCAMLFLLIGATVFYGVELYPRQVARIQSYHEQQLRQQNSARYNLILDEVLNAGLTTAVTLLETTSPQARALRWLSYSDEARLDPKDPFILQRYALAVFFYSSFADFQKQAGKQDPIEHGDGDDQFQGVPNPGWYRHDHWLSEKGICLWFGVECEFREVPGLETRRYDDNSAVLFLNMTDNHVLGSLPQEFKTLDSLEVLDLSHNKLSGSFPSLMGYLTELRLLFLNHNKLSGPLPTDMGNLQGLHELRLEKNTLSGSIPTQFNRLYHIKHLDLSDNKLQFQFPSIRSLSSLEMVDLGNNQFTGTFPFSFAKIASVREIHVEKNQMKGTVPPELETLENLRILSMHENSLSGRFPNGVFESNEGLNRVSIHLNKFHGSIPTLAGKLTALHTLQMNDNDFTGTFPTEWTDMASLEVLHLNNNKLHGSLPGTIGLLTSLMELWLENNELDGVVPSELAELEHLTLAYLDHNQVSGQLPTQIGQMSKLQTLRLEENILTGAVPEAVCNLKENENLVYLTTDCENEVICDCCNQCF